MSITKSVFCGVTLYLVQVSLATLLNITNVILALSSFILMIVGIILYSLPIMYISIACGLAYHVCKFFLYLHDKEETDYLMKKSFCIRNTVVQITLKN